MGKVKKMTAKGFINVLIPIGLITWLAICMYSISSKSSALIYDYEHELHKKEADIINKLSYLMRLNSHPPQAVVLWQDLCKLQLCKGNIPTALSDLTALFHFTNDGINDTNQFNIYLFGGNIYRDCGELRESLNCYQQSIAKLDDLQSANNPNINKLEIQKNKAINLNNIGLVYYLMGKNESNKEEKKKNYYAANACFEKAKSLISNPVISENSSFCLSKIIQNNMTQSSTELKFVN